MKKKEKEKKKEEKKERKQASKKGTLFNKKQELKSGPNKIKCRTTNS